MTAEEIKAMVASVITGQGNQVDSGGKLGEILNAIVDMAGQGVKPIEIPCTFDPGKQRIDPTTEGKAIIKEKGLDLIGAVLVFDTSPIPPATGPNSYDVAQVVAVNKNEGDHPYYSVFFLNRVEEDFGFFTVRLAE